MSSGSTFRLFAGYNYNRTQIQGEVATPLQLAGLGNVLFDRVERGRFECGQPRHQARVIGDFSKGRFSANANVGLYGSFCVKQLLATGADDQIFSKKWVTDLEVSYRLEKLTLGVGVQNLTDAYPEQVLARLNTQGVRYPTTNTFGINGRFLYARANVRF
jgi:iron complex outermembrane receptor protein